jgi:hypothetical protein
MGVVIAAGLLLVLTGVAVRWYVNKREATMRSDVKILLAKVPVILILISLVKIW